MLWVTIAKRWHQPMIYTWVDDDGIELSMPLEDFIKAIIDEIPTSSQEDIKKQLCSSIFPWRIKKNIDNLKRAFFTSDNVSSLVNRASEQVVKKMKMETNKMKIKQR